MQGPPESQAEGVPAAPAKRPRVGLLIRLEDYAYQRELIAGAAAACDEFGADLCCFGGDHLLAPGARNGAYAIARSLTDLHGVVIALGTLASEDADAAERFVRSFQHHRLCVIGGDFSGCPSVGVDNRGGMRAATRHLIEKHGRRRLAFVGARNLDARERFEGFRVALEEAAIPFESRWMLQGDLTEESGRQAVRALLVRPERPLPDAIVAANDWMALGVLEGLEEAGLRVPRDIAVIGFDDIEESRFSSPALSTVHQSPRKLGHLGISVVLGVADAATLAADPSPRASCGCAPKLQVPTAAVASQTEALLSALGQDRQSWIDTLEGVAPREPFPPPTGFAEALVDAFLLDLQEGTEQAFSRAVEKLCWAVATHSSVAPWHQVITLLREATLLSLAGAKETWLRAVMLFERAQLAIALVSEATQGANRLEREALLRELTSLGTELHTALDYGRIAETLLTHARRLHINTLIVAATLDTTDRRQNFFALALDNGKQRTWQPQADRAQQSPEDCLRQALERSRAPALLLQPLFFDDIALGYCALALEPHGLVMARLVPSLISSALRACALTQALVTAEAERKDAEHARMREEMRIAAAMQTALVPREPQLPRLDLAGSSRPATEAGGDYFDALPAPGGAWLTIGDVAGHGLHTGMIMLMLQSIVATATAALPNATPSELWLLTNRLLSHNIRERLGRDEHTTLTLIRYHDDGRLEFAGAHEDLVIVRANPRDPSQPHYEHFETSGLWAGIRAEAEEQDAPQGHCQLYPGDLLLLHTDGVTETRNETGEALGLERLSQLAARHAQLTTSRAIVDALLDYAQAWGKEQADDMTLVVARFC